MVVIEEFLAVLRNIQTSVSAVVVITGHAAQAVSRARRARLFSHVGKRAVAVVAIKRVAFLNAALIKIAPVDEVDVLPSVAVVIEYAYARPGFFEDGRGPVGAFKVRESNARRFCDVGELSCRGRLAPKE